MTKPAPRRRPLHRDPLDVETTLKRELARAPETELGWSVLNQEMRGAGWPARTPDDDRTTHHAHITILCRDCDTVLADDYAQAIHRNQTGHELYAYQPTPRTGEQTVVTMVWRCDCGHTFQTAAQADTHLEDSGHESHERVSTGHQTSGIDYADPCGAMALRYDRLAADLAQIQDDWRTVTRALRRMADTAHKYMPASSAHKPGCSIGSCDEPVEATATGYRGMEQVAGVWCAKVGAHPVCGRHRKQEWRATG